MQVVVSFQKYHLIPLGQRLHFFQNICNATHQFWTETKFTISITCCPKGELWDWAKVQKSGDQRFHKYITSVGFGTSSSNAFSPSAILALRFCIITLVSRRIRTTLN